MMGGVVVKISKGVFVEWWVDGSIMVIKMLLLGKCVKVGSVFVKCVKFEKVVVWEGWWMGE